MLQGEQYLSFADYKRLGGKLENAFDAFPHLERKAQRYLDYITFNRVKELENIPEEVLEVLTEFVDRMVAFEAQSEGGDLVSTYSNGVESFTYARKSEETLLKEFKDIAIKWLPDYLTCRLVNFNVADYLQ